MRESDARLDGRGDAAAVVVSHVVRRYAPGNWSRRHALFARLGGIKPGLEHELFMDDDDVDDADDGFDDDRVEMDEAVPGESVKVALDDASFRASAGSGIAIVGPPGSGKSVLLRVIAGIAPPSEGKVLVRGVVAPVLGSVQRLFPRDLELRKAVPFMWMVLQVPVPRPKRRVQEVFALIGDPSLPRRRVSMTRGWPTWKQILYAMMLVVEPHVLLLDLDLPDGAFGDLCRQRILELKRNGAIVIVASQDVESVSWIADRVLTMRRGRIVGDEPIGAALEATHA